MQARTVREVLDREGLLECLRSDDRQVFVLLRLGDELHSVDLMRVERFSNELACDEGGRRGTYAEAIRAFLERLQAD